jgi:uncharacterized spore protein YtfJ
MPKLEKEDFMEHVSDLLKTALGEIERVLSTKTVVGEPITVEGNTLIPLISIGFGFGAGGGSGKVQKAPAGEGLGGGTGGGGGIKPVALIIINKEGVRVEPIKGATANILEKFGGMIGKAMEKKQENKAGP